MRRIASATRKTPARKSRSFTLGAVRGGASDPLVSSASMPRLASREIARDFIYLSTTRSLSLAISLVRSLIIPKFLGPTSYGLWKTLGLVQSYTQFADLGALAALKRQIPFHAQRDDHRSLNEDRDVAFFVHHVVIFTAASGILATSLFVP